MAEQCEADERDGEEEELLSQHSDHTSNTSFYGEIPTRRFFCVVDVGIPRFLTIQIFCSSSSPKKREWKRTNCKYDGRVVIIGEWISKTECRRAIVIGPDWPCVIITYFVIIIPSVFVELYLLKYFAEVVLFWILLPATLLGLTLVFFGGALLTYPSLVF